MADPKIILLDEPSLGLAPALVVEIFRLVAVLRDQGLGILLSEQNARQSLMIADQAYVMEMGAIALQGTGRELLDMPEVAERYLGVGRGLGEERAERHRHFAERLRAAFAAR